MQTDDVIDVVLTQPDDHVSGMDERSYARLGWLIVLVGVCGFLVWAFYAPLDKGVPVTGTVITDGNRKSVQHPAGGIIDQILVKDGDVVKAGQLLIRMDATQITANINGVRESIQGLEFLIRGLSESRDSKQQQLKFLNEQLVGMRELASEGYVARNRVLELDRQAAQIRGAISEDIGNIGRNQKQIAELRERIVGYQFDLGNTQVKAPVEGVVQGLTMFTPRGVVSPGMKLMDLVPQGNPLMIEGEAPPHLIDKIKVGLEVEMMFTAFNQNKTPHIPGKVAMVSPDRLIEERTGVPYYKIHAQVTPEGMQKLKGLEVRPGMPVDVFIKTGERSLMSYLFKPVTDRLHNALSQD